MDTEMPESSHASEPGKSDQSELSASKRSRKERKERGRKRDRVGSVDVSTLQATEAITKYLNLGAAAHDIIPADPQSDLITDKSQSALSLAIANFGGEQSASLPTNHIWIQQPSGFRKTQKDQFERLMAERKRREEDEIEAEKRLNLTNSSGIEAGLIVQSGFMSLAILLQGLLAGFSIFHALLVLMFTTPRFSNIDFLTHYATLAMPLHICYYVSFVFCLVAVLDRYDVSHKPGRCAWRAFTFQSGGVCMVAYMISIVLGLSFIPVEEKMSFYDFNSTAVVLTQAGSLVVEKAWLSGDLGLWKTCVVVRAAATSFGWAFVAFRPATNLLSKHLRTD